MTIHTPATTTLRRVADQGKREDCPVKREQATFPMEPSSPTSRSRAPNSQEVYLRAAIGVDHSADGFAAPAGHLEGADNEFGAEMVGDRPAHNPAGMEILARPAHGPDEHYFGSTFSRAK
jgi:hypothetical protein